jgi:hypothetical protein
VSPDVEAAGTANAWDGASPSHERKSTMPINVNKAVDKAYEGKSLNEILRAPVSALEGVSEETGRVLGDLGIRTVADLGQWKIATSARALVELARLEE